MSGTSERIEIPNFKNFYLLVPFMSTITCQELPKRQFAWAISVFIGEIGCIITAKGEDSDFPIRPFQATQFAKRENKLNK